MGIKASVIILSQHVPQKLLDDLHKQTFKDFETIVAADKGIVTAMNNALKIAKGEIFIRIDDDVHLDTTWLEELLKPFDYEWIGGVTGPTYIPYMLRRNRDSIDFVNNNKNNPILRWLFDGDILAPAKIYKCGSVSYGSNFQESITNKEYDIDHLEGTNWAMRTNLIKAVGGFDPKFDGVCEWFDDDVVYKIKKRGYKIKYNPKAVLYHMVSKGENFSDRFQGWGRIKNYLRFHFRHSKFHYKKIIWVMLMIAYFIKSKWRK